MVYPPTDYRSIRSSNPLRAKTMPKKIVASEAPVEVSTSKAEFQAVIDAYKLQNPAKYEAKKEALEAKLKELK